MTKTKTITATISKASLDAGIKTPAPSRRFIYLSLTLLFVLALFVGYNLERTDLSLALQQQREKTLRDASLLATKIQQEVNSTFYLIVGLTRMIEINGQITERQFNEICAGLIRSRPGLLNIAAAPDMVIRHVYPLEGNAAVLGLDYAKHPQQREAAFRVKTTGQPVIAGPVQLVQGGEAVIGRFPVYVYAPGTQEPRFWGIISTPFDTSVLYRESGLLDPSLSLQVSLRGHDSLGAAGDIFFGPATIEAQEPVYFPIELFSGSWQMAAVPKGGWLQTSPRAWYIRSAVGAFTLLLGVVLWLYYQHTLRKKRIQEAEHSVLQTKERFYANMSHELRTPLNGICGLSQIIDISTSEQEIKHFAQDILRSGETLTRLLEDVLVLSRDEDGEVEQQTIELESFLDELLPPLLQEAERKGLKFIQKPLPAECIQPRCHEAMLRQILWNLLSNAVKFTQTGSVTLEVSAPAAGRIAYRISDTGIGIAPDSLQTIFNDFTQADDSMTRHFGGAGLGLAVVRRFVLRLGGSVSVESEQAHGSVFTVVLPN